MLRYLLLVVVSLVPLSGVRKTLYRALFGFKIAKTAKIGMFNLLDIRQLTMKEHAEIRGFGNVFMSMYRVEMDEYARIGAPRVGLNLFRGTANKGHVAPAGLKMGKCALIELMHYFDTCGDIILGDNAIIGGIKCVFFTHALYKDEYDPIEIGENVYVGSNCLFQMGVKVPANAVVGMGSVLVKPIEQEGALIAGVPARVVRENAGFSMKQAMQLRRKPFAENGKVIVPEKVL